MICFYLTVFDLVFLNSEGNLEKKMVEVAGVEPACRRGPMRTSTCLFHLCFFSSFAEADEQAWLQTILSFYLALNRKTIVQSQSAE